MVYIYNNKQFKLAVLVLVMASLLVGGLYLPAILAENKILPLQEITTIAFNSSSAVLRGIRFNPDDPLKLEFIIDSSSKKKLTDQEVKRIINYFLAGLTIPQEDLWVNLSPYEKERIIPKNLGFTGLGKDLLIQDYILKQLVCSLTDPSTKTGKAYWRKINSSLAKSKAKSNKLTINSFHKIWLMPNKSTIYETDNSSFVGKSSLKALVEEDYLALKQAKQASLNKSQDKVILNAFKTIILPEVEKQINTGQNFARLRQVYYSLILSLWFKEKFQDTFYKYYINKNKIEGINLQDKNIRDEIYRLYLQANKQGSYNCVRKEYDWQTQHYVTKRYYSGGIKAPQGKDIKVVSLDANRLCSNFFQQEIEGEIYKTALRFSLDQPYLVRVPAATNSNEAALMEEIINDVIKILCSLRQRQFAAILKQLCVKEIINFNNLYINGDFLKYLKDKDKRYKILYQIISHVLNQMYITAKTKELSNAFITHLFVEANCVKAIDSIIAYAKEIGEYKEFLVDPELIVGNYSQNNQLLATEDKPFIITMESLAGALKVEHGKQLLYIPLAVEAKMRKVHEFIRNRDYAAETAIYGLTKKIDDNTTVLVDCIIPRQDKVFYIDTLFLEQTVDKLISALAHSASLSLILANGAIFIESDQSAYSFMIEDRNWDIVYEYIKDLVGKELVLKDVEGLKKYLSKQVRINLDTDWDFIVTAGSVSLTSKYFKRVNQEAAKQNANANYTMHYHPHLALGAALYAEKPLNVRQNYYKILLRPSDTDLRHMSVNDIEWFEIRAMSYPEDLMENNHFTRKFYNMPEINIITLSVKKIIDDLVALPTDEIDFFKINEYIQSLILELDKLEKLNLDLRAVISWLCGIDIIQQFRERFRPREAITNIKDLVLAIIYTHDNPLESLRNTSLEVLEMHSIYHTHRVYQQVMQLYNTADSARKELISNYLTENNLWWLSTERDIEKIKKGVELAKKLLDTLTISSTLVKNPVGGIDLTNKCFNLKVKNKAKANLFDKFNLVKNFNSLRFKVVSLETISCQALAEFFTPAETTY